MLMYVRESLQRQRPIRFVLEWKDSVSELYHIRSPTDDYRTHFDRPDMFDDSNLDVRIRTASRTHSTKQPLAPDVHVDVAHDTANERTNERHNHNSLLNRARSNCRSCHWKSSRTIFASVSSRSRTLRCSLGSTPTLSSPTRHSHTRWRCECTALARAHSRSLAFGAPSHVIVNSYVGDRELRRAHTGNLEFLRWDEWVEFDNMPINRVRTLHGSFACKLLLTLVVLRARLSSCSCHAIRASVCLSTSRAKANLASSVG